MIRVLLLGGVGLLMFSAAFHTDESPVGYLYKMNQRGLAVDNTLSFNLVLPNGTVTHVTQSTYPDLFFGLKR